MGLSCSRFKKAVCSNCFVSMILWFSFFSNENTLQFDMFLYLSVVYPTSVEYNCTIVIIAVKVMKMVWIVCILAAALAGIGTGLVGLSAATVMVPLLIIAPVSAFVELYTKHGLDTITVPIAASLILGAAALIL